MKVAAQEIEHSQVVLDIEVEDERLERAVDQAYKRIVQRINVPGFRKGKAPRALVERMVGREALVEDAVEQLVPQVVEDAVKQQELVMVARLRQNDLEVVSMQPLQIKATVPVKPKVELGDYKSLKIEATPAEVTDEQVDAVVNRLRESHATWEPVERAAELGDRVAIDVLAKAGETTVMESKDAEYVISEDGPQPAEGFAQALVGMQAEESKTVTLKLPEEHRNKELAGQDAEFELTVHWVKAKILPELDDELPSTVGTEHESLDAACARRSARTCRPARSTSGASPTRRRSSTRSSSRRRWSCRRSSWRRRPAASSSSSRRTSSVRASRCRAIYVSHRRRKNSSGPK